MNRVAVFFMSIVVILISNTSWAACAGIACSDVYIEQLYIRSSGPNLVQTSGDETALNCTPDSDVFLEIQESANEKEILSVLLSAQMADKKATLRIIDNSPRCEIMYITLNK